MKKYFYKLIAILGLLGFPLISRAATLSPFTSADIPSLIGNILRVALGFTGVVALIMIIYGGFLWLTSGGNADRVKKGRDTLVWAILGLALIFGAYAIVNTVVGGVIGATTGTEGT